MSIKSELLILLTFFYTTFVIGDVITTFWLIKFYPKGISGEINPMAHLIFQKYGYIGMLISKISFFIVSSTIFIALYKKYGYINWFKDALETTILGLSGLSILVIINNFFSILTTSTYIYGGPPIILLKILIFLLTIVIAEIGVMTLFRDTLKSIQTLIGCTVAMAPLFIWPTLEPIYYLIYLASLSIIIVVSTYLIETAKITSRNRDGR